MNKKPAIIVIVGPTATGKSDLAVTIAKKLDGEIISADSRQVYRGLDIGSGKITKKEMKGVPHHLLDVYSPKRIFTASKFKLKAEEAITKILNKGKVPIIVGGTGFYIQTIVDNLNLPAVKPNSTFRKKLTNKSTEELFLALQKLDPARAKTIDKHNRVRLIRALELVETIGKTPTLSPNKSPWNFLQIGLNPGVNHIYLNIKKRLRQRLNQGLIAEVAKLSQAGLSDQRLFNLGLEYRYVSLYLKGEIKKKEMIEKLEQAINQYAKRQMTWFKRDKNINWFKNSNEALEYVDRQWSKIID